MYVINSEKGLIFNWATDLEDGALQQAINLSNLPFVHHHVALMPDAHQGYGVPIGGVIATNGVVIPNAVGVDIGCGMAFMETDIQNYDIAQLRTIVEAIKDAIPVGFKQHAQAQEWDTDGAFYEEDVSYVFKEQYEKSTHQLGTLGGGNHFIELQLNKNNCLCVMIHSGSRNLGKTIADYHNKIAIDLNESYYSSVPKEYGLAFLPLDLREGQRYMNDMNLCVEFARQNRRRMIEIVASILSTVFSNYERKFNLDVPHNYAGLENHYGRNVMVHRKGATMARLDQPGIIPGSQGTASYLVSGLGNKESFNSCSHGAGRAMGRKQAQRQLNLEEEIKYLNSKGIIHNITSIEDLDEAPSAYKDIERVMEDQKDLVTIKERLIPLAVVKG